ncbi:uncharacterized protein HMPREF1541_05171 [Cyphellophora europaea CBS 101466]|uniref:PH domain-containing protein n=1 Tax=Cyphellophora europaea (strain CBS 101466) TaxID=1220924 RepID=W2RWP4_CYPE1|nr:uncharacterized protein HMPREF1541_05171 [Cyphellophora europaea CBS 101466]ETN40891.1 hypothetical protein HMPREF1541_05171 [Cyphellophora europaea CBS 101466]
MAADIAAFNGMRGENGTSIDYEDPFVDEGSPSAQAQPRRLFPSIGRDPFHATSTSDAKHLIEEQLQENERRLEEAQKLGTSLLQQQDDLQQKLKELGQREDESEITPELRQQLAQLEREHDDVGREIAKALLPKSRAVSAEEKPQPESTVYSSQATASPTKVTAPSRRQRNQPSGRAGDLQFAADISTSLLAQVRQLQAAVAERDDLIKQTQADHSRIELDTVGLTQRLRTLDENEQRYKDENWNLETQNHQLQATAREAAEREKKLSASLAAALVEKSRVQNEVDEIRLAHDKLSEEHTAAKKAHDTEVHGLKRAVDLGDGEKAALQSKVDELTSQNQELAQAITAKFRSHQAQLGQVSGVGEDIEDRDLDMPDESPPPSPTKATPRHPGLESETLRSSLHHAHRMIQNLKNNIHREKTEKIELKRMLQDARDELEQKRDTAGSGTKRQKTKDGFRKGPRPEMLGANRRPRTDVELEDEDWEERGAETPTHGRRHLSIPGAFAQTTATDTSDAYDTATDADRNFETADEKHTTESEEFATGAESLAGDSTDDLTETEDNTTRTDRTATIKGKPSLVLKPAGDRTSFMSTASTSAGEEEDELTTPVPTQSKFRLKNARGSMRNSRQFDEGTPTSQRALSVVQGSSPATITNDRSPAAPEQSLFDQLGDMDELGSNGFGTPGRQSINSAKSTPYTINTPGKRLTSFEAPPPLPTVVMVDTAMMTEPWEPGPRVDSTTSTKPSVMEGPFASNFPLPPSVPVSPVRKADMSTQYTPQRMMDESPSRNANNFITPPKTVWDQASEAGLVSPEADSREPATPKPHLGYSGMLIQDTAPQSPPAPAPVPEPMATFAHNYSAIASMDTTPESPQAPKSPAALVGSLDEQQAPAETARPKTAEKVAAAGGAGLLATAAAAIGLLKSKNQAPAIAEDETSEQARVVDDKSDHQRALHAISENAAAGRTPDARQTSSAERPAFIKHPSHDQGSQTLLTADQIDQVMRPKSAGPKAVPVLSPTSPQSEDSVGLPPIIAVPSPVKRPGSANSNRTSSLIRQDHPPLPPDHKTAIAKARVSSPVRSPTQEFSNAGQPGTVMGPPMMPASAMRRPRTPADGSMRSPTRDSNASRATVQKGHQRGVTSVSQISRRSSVSSFASELDERFNIRPGQVSASHGFEASPGTDPRMIQAITQTMIGEFLWKYTRKTGRSEMSGNRHRRYFWVHPYTKTLYWSDQDPQTAGRNELKAKSVAIEAVRVVTDDNPMPPGLHRKSLEVITPGRKVRFTASTGQRHETWFNALSYLLLRGEQDPTKQVATGYTTGDTEVTRDDVNEFNVSANGYGARLVPNSSRVSMSSYNSRTTRGTSLNRGSVRHSAVPGVATSSVRPTAQPAQAGLSTADASRLSRAEQSREADKDQTLRSGSMNRFSRMMGSVTGRTSRSANHAGDVKSGSTSIYDASVVSDNRQDSAEQLRQEMLREEEGLENVRSCCDGKHDVSTLSHAHRHAATPSHSHRNWSVRGSIARRSTTNTGA